MPFLPLEEDEIEFFNEHSVLHDRIIGLVIPTLIDRRLSHLIKDRWHDTEKGDLLNDLFRDGGALGSLHTRAQVGFAIGLYDENIFADLKRIVKIRNAFAHQPGARDFNTQPSCDYTRKFVLPECYPKETLTTLQTDTREKRIERLLRASDLIDLKPIRTRYLRTTEIVLTRLSIELGHFELPSS